jgi:hypothetical protein
MNPTSKQNFQDPYKNNFSIVHNSGPLHNPYKSEYKDSIGELMTPANLKNVPPAGKEEEKGNFGSTILLGTDAPHNVSEHHDQ